MCISSPLYLITVPNINKIHPAIIEECVRTGRQTNGWMDWMVSNIPRFCLGGAVNNIQLFMCEISQKCITVMTK